MDTKQIADIIGYIAAALGIVTFIPQALDIWKTKNTKSISLMTFSLLAIISVLWVAYGILLGAFPLVLVNSVVLVLTGFIVAMKLKHG